MSKVRSGFLFLLLLICSSAKADVLSDFSISKKQLQKVSESKEWQRLLQYRKPWWGGYRSALKGSDYFLSLEGSTNPNAELEASLEILFEKKPDQQCDYLARTDFILRTWPNLLAKVVRCTFFEDWKARMGAKKVSLIFATSYLNSAASSFGHTFLRLENPKNISRGELLDYGVNFSAQTGSSFDALYALYGLTGHFPGRFAMTPYHQMIKEYTNLEGRDLWEYHLNLSEVEVDRLLKYLFEMKKTYIDYYFLDDNCSYQVLWALQVVRPDLDLVHEEEPWLIPLDSVKMIERSHLIESKKYRPSLVREWETRLKGLSSEEKNQLKELLQKISNSKEDLELSNSVAVIEAAQVYIDLKNDEEPATKKNKSFLLSKKRAQIPTSVGLKIPTPLVSPESTHDSSSVGFAQGFRDLKSYQTLRVEAAFHAWLSDDTGVSPFSELKVLNFEFRNYPNQFRLEKAMPLKILSTRSIDRFFQPFSWGTEISYDRYLLLPEVDRPLGKGQVGYSYDVLEDTRVMAFIYGGVERNLEQNISGIYGLEARILSKIAPHFRVGLIGRQENQSATTQMTEFLAESTLDLNSQWELRAYYGVQKLFSSSLRSPTEPSEEYGLSLFHSFILPGYHH